MALLEKFKADLTNYFSFTNLCPQKKEISLKEVNFAFKPSGVTQSSLGQVEEFVDLGPQKRFTRYKFSREKRPALTVTLTIVQGAV